VLSRPDEELDRNLAIEDPRRTVTGMFPEHPSACGLQSTEDSAIAARGWIRVSISDELQALRHTS
jgi:hypothetical protein